MTNVRSGRNSAGLRSARLEGKVAVDLVRDDGEIVRAGELGDLAHECGRGERARRVVGQRQDEDPGPAAVGPGRRDRLGQGGRARHAACLTDRDVPDAPAGELGLGRVAHPRGAGEEHVPGQHVQQREEEGLAARREDHLLGPGRQAPPGEVAGGRDPGGDRSLDRAVAVVGSAAGEHLGEAREDGQARLAEGQMDDGGPGGDPPAYARVGGERRRGAHRAHREGVAAHLRHRAVP